MNDYVIIPDVTCDLPKELRERFGIVDYVRSHLNLPDGTDIPSDLDWGYSNPTDFYKMMKNKKNVFSTSTPTPEDFIACWEKFLKEGKDIISVTISSALSGTYGFSCKAKEMLEKKYPERRIVCIDSLRYSTAFGVICCYAGEKRLNGATFDEVVSWINENKNCFHQMGPMEDLYFLARKGRINNFKAFMGTLVGVKPCGDFNNDGMTTVLYKPKGQEATYNFCIEYIRKTIIKPEEQYIFISNTARKEQAEELARRIKEAFNPKEVFVVDVQPACGINVGPGLYAAYYYGNKIEDDMAYEKQVVSEITKQ